MLLLQRILTAMLTRGALTLIGPDGRTYQAGQGTPQIAVKLSNNILPYRIAAAPGLSVGEAYMSGDLEIINGTIYDLLGLIFQNIGWQEGHWYYNFSGRLRRITRRVMQYNPMPRARRNVAHHYDLSDELYDLFLDSDRQYSCAYFKSPDDDLETAQINKKQHIADKLLLAPGQTVLDIGSGWGGLGLFIAGQQPVQVTGVTLSENQHAVSNRRAVEMHVADRVSFRLQDYRTLNQKFDRIVSVGMFEHVGVGHFREFFQKLSGMLAPGGVALLHTIGRTTGPGVTNRWIDKYIFPGGYIPAASEIVPEIERAGLYITDIEFLRLHYADTIVHWRDRFAANRTRIRALYDERFCRMWEFYLAASEAAFRYSGQVVFQFQLSKEIDAVPLTRDYLYATPMGEPARKSIAIEAAE